MKRTVKIFVWITFAIYCIVLFKLLFLDMRVRFTSEGISAHLAISNFIPFKTIFNYIEKAAAGKINSSTAVVNIVGNLVAFLPLGCYLPCLFKRLRRFWLTIPLILCLILAVEILQPVLCVGVLDVDDIILNISGAIIGFGIINIPMIKCLLKRIYIYT